MTSLKAKILIGIMRKRHLFKGKLRKETLEWNEESILKFRDNCERGAERFGKLPEGITVQPETIANISSEWLIPENAADDKLIFYVHGGGYVSGSCNDHRNIVSKITLQTGVTTLLYEYGLAPEKPFPAALKDSLAVYCEVLAKRL